ncbi:MAG: hypothetical protein JJ974_11045 [Phycisphaerales bacterium]|nr:hypothetical protein [Phycisphaerales bacterium]
MNSTALTGLVLFGLAGGAIASDDPTRLEATQGNIKHVGHIYYNVATGEKITTLLDAGDTQRPSDGDASSEIWIVSGNGCQDFGDTLTFFFQLDDPSDTSMLNQYLFDWGDIEMDTVVDCVQIHWITDHKDVDLVDGNGDPNPDGFADGIEGFAATWTYWDAMNGRAPEFDSIALPIVSIGFFGLPGELSDTLDQTVAFYTADVDLGGSFGTPLVFEIGDTDGDLQGAAVHNSELDERFNGFPGVPDIDPDGDGLADWGWSLIFDQPGTIDVDNADGDSDVTTGIDGDPLALETAGVLFGVPFPSQAEYDSVTDTWSLIPDGPTAGAVEDLFNLAENGPGGEILMTGPFFFGGFSCTLPGNLPNSGHTPMAAFNVTLYRSLVSSCCLTTDLNCDGEVDFFDISLFLTNQVDYNGDTVFDFFDISLFLSEFLKGCP